jgi:hypothetical protein
MFHVGISTGQDKLQNDIRVMVSNRQMERIDASVTLRHIGTGSQQPTHVR